MTPNVLNGLVTFTVLLAMVVVILWACRQVRRRGIGSAIRTTSGEADYRFSIRHRLPAVHSFPFRVRWPRALSVAGRNHRPGRTLRLVLLGL